MNPLEIRVELMRRGITISEIAKKHKVVPMTVSSVIYGKFQNIKIMKSIVKIIGKSVSEIFPEYEGKQKRKPKRNPYKLGERLTKENIQPVA
ncbi:MAG TPA: helix-turn-helix domain-containing protein [bacterium]|nr:helix-turn-helix domain-containing protein [bacterium]